MSTTIPTTPFPDIQRGLPHGPGAWVCIKVNLCICYGTVVDMQDGKPLPKRVRLQKGWPLRQGDVVFPNEYEFRCWADEEETP